MIKTIDWFKLLYPIAQQEEESDQLSKNDLWTGCIKMSDKKTSFKCW
jgi:hypothetical protein